MTNKSTDQKIAFLLERIRDKARVVERMTVDLKHDLNASDLTHPAGKMKVGMAITRMNSLAKELSELEGLYEAANALGVPYEDMVTAAQGEREAFYDLFDSYNGGDYWEAKS